MIMGKLGKVNLFFFLSNLLFEGSRSDITDRPLPIRMKANYLLFIWHLFGHAHALHVCMHPHSHHSAVVYGDLRGSWLHRPERITHNDAHFHQISCWNNGHNMPILTAFAPRQTKDHYWNEKWIFGNVLNKLLLNVGIALPIIEDIITPGTHIFFDRNVGFFFSTNQLISHIPFRAYPAFLENTDCCFLLILSSQKSSMPAI